MLGTAMYEVSSVGGNRLEAAAAIRAQAVPRHRPHETVKGHMLRFLRRSKSMAQRAVSTEDHHHQTQQREHAPLRSNKHHHHQSHHQDKRESVGHQQGQQQIQHPVTRNGVVVAIVDGLPFVVGAKNKPKVLFISKLHNTITFIILNICKK